jgi:hypothetical protein
VRIRTASSIVATAELGGGAGERHPALARHPRIGDHQIDAVAHQNGTCGSRAPRRADPHAVVAAEQLRQQLQDVGLVVDYENMCHRAYASAVPPH